MLKVSKYKNFASLRLCEKKMNLVSRQVAKIAKVKQKKDKLNNEYYGGD